MTPNAATILIIEDDHATRTLYERELGAYYSVLACADAQTAFELLRDAVIDVVVLEPSLPDGRGWSLLETIRGTAATHSLPVILCSTTDQRRRGTTLGASASLIKPVLPVMLCDLVRRLLSTP